MRLSRVNSKLYHLWLLLSQSGDGDRHYAFETVAPLEPMIGREAIEAFRRVACSVRKVNMTISLAFLAPDLIKAAIDGRLPHGMGVACLTDLPAEWSRQHEMLGLPSH